MRRVDFETFMSFRPCKDWPAERVKAIYDEYPDGMTALDILHREDVSANDKLWAVLWEEFIDARTLHEFACICAEYALSLVDEPDPRSVAAVETKRRWLRGKATNAELASARFAARAAAMDAAVDAAWNDARFAAWLTAADTAVNYAVRPAQFAVLEMMIGEEDHV